ncbi:MAG: F0F1 ATP synthase subunit A [Desulfovibrionaceae bacterium]|nr:F0F1 ATP synthase subunit A [Desulfovibrionaceae bacterium]MBO4793527.1 F0F1 ATP synthase subunit A [Deltaproteobacteria bacterium]MBR5735074.1 F0F1 ATP synthase subunit A [Desulfovibrionaceae bacterium]
MAAGLPEPLLLSHVFNMNEMTIAGHHLHTSHIFYTWLAMLVMLLLALLVRRKLTLVPGRLQNFFEVIIDGLENFTVANMGENGRKVFPVLCGLFLIIAIENLMGLLPGCDAPTANVNTNLAMGLFIFLYYNAVGICRWGGGYIKHFMGPMAAMAPFMFCLEIISHLARPLSLTLRLFGNIRGEEIVLVLFFLLAPIAGTLPIYFLFLLAKCLQAFIFYILSMLYLKSAMEPAH